MSESKAIAELVTQLRSLAGPVKPNLLDQAADTIERLVSELEDCKANAGEP